MTTVNTAHHEHHDSGDKTVFGIWVFLLSDFIMFAALFAAYAVLKNNVAGSIDIRHLTHLPYELIETLALLTCSFTYGLSAFSMYRGSKGGVIFWLFVTLLFGLAFVGLEYHQLSALLAQGYSWHNSAFLSSFFTLVGLHGAHVVVALLWILVLMVQFGKKGIIPAMKPRLTSLGLFIHFLNIVWVLIFFIVYLLGAL